VSSEIPEGYEPQTHSFAKNHALDALEFEIERQGQSDLIEMDADDNVQLDLIDLADAVVEALIAAGVTIPDNISNPHAL
jgi:hypothetical protein